MAYLATQHGDIYYQVRGQGEPVVLLHGLARSSRYWLGFDRQLAKRFQVITIDARGLGRSQAATFWRQTPYDLADDVAAVLHALKLKQAHVLGLSLGGMVALAFGIKHRAMAQTLSVVNTSAGGLGYPRLLPRAWLALAGGLLLHPLRHYFLLNACLGRTSSPHLRRRVLKAWRRIEQSEGVPYATFAKQLLAAVRFRSCQELQALSVPTLVVYGSDDNFVAKENSQALARLLPQGRLCEIPHAGHEISLDKPRELIACFAEFIAEAGQARP